MKKKIRVGAVNYLNTKPLIYGFGKGDMKDEIELVLDYPSRIAEMLLEDEIDVGLVPVTILPRLKEHYIISDYCIGCDGAVASVCLFSDVPLMQIEKILLDYQSNTSVELLKILIKQYWKIEPVLETTSEEYHKDIHGTTAGLLIGDRALEQNNRFKFTYDLGKEWKCFTGLPFVFAAWVANKKMEPQFIKSFNSSNKLGLELIDKVIAENSYTVFDVKKYYTEHITYVLSNEKRQAMNVFLDKLSNSR